MITLAQYERISARHNAAMTADPGEDLAKADTLFEDATETIADPGERITSVTLHNAAVRHAGTGGEDATRQEFYDHLAGLLKKG